MAKIIEDFRFRLEKALADNNMKPSELAEKTGISQSTISQYRSGYSKPKDKRLVLIAEVLGVDPAWLMGLDVIRSGSSDSNEQGEEYSINMSLSDREYSHLSTYRSLTDPGKDRVDTYTDKVKSLEAEESDQKVIETFQKRFVARNGNKNLSPDEMKQIMNILDKQ